jgi:hypothetical protein
MRSTTAPFSERVELLEAPVRSIGPLRQLFELRGAERATLRKRVRFPGE